MQQAAFGDLLWQPPPALASASEMSRYLDWLQARRGLYFRDYAALWQWSVDHLEDFWATIWEYFGVRSHSPWHQVLRRSGEGVMGARWFEGATLSYAEHVFRHASEERPALLAQSEGRPLRAMSWAELQGRTASLAAWMRRQGIGKGDRVAAWLPNVPEALIAFLAANSLGAIWSSCSPDFGVQSVLDRFQQIEPKLLLAADGYRYNGRPFDRRGELAALLGGLPSVAHGVWLPYLDPQAPPPPGLSAWEETQQEQEAELRFEAVEFDFPIWVLYSSGTTGKPKAIVHGTGGMLLEHLKALTLHQDCRPGDRFFWYSTTGWMMWNYANAALLTGASVLLYDGSAGWPDLRVLWDLAQAAEVNHFGAGAAFYLSCMKAGLRLREGELPALRSVGSTGSPLPPEGFAWIYEAIKPDLWLVSLSGGTDVCSGFVGGCPFLPVYAGEIQCRMLGCKVEAWDEAGQPLREEVGELVITEPMPAMPVSFWNDPEQRRYRASYFEDYPGVWRHGDWLRITERDTLVIYGRSDATLNRDGVRIGTSEIYRVVESLPEVRDSLVVCIERAAGDFYMPLFVVLAEGQALGVELAQKIRQELRSRCSPRHVPDEILPIAEVPYTISGKKMEMPVKKILLGKQPAEVASPDAMRNPAALEAFRQWQQQP